VRGHKKYDKVLIIKGRSVIRWDLWFLGGFSRNADGLILQCVMFKRS